MALSTINLTSGMRSNLFSLQKTSDSMEITQNRLATGLNVNTALDDPINFFAAQEHRLRASDLASRKDGMSEAIQTIKAANVGVEGINNLIAQAKSLAQSAMSATSTLPSRLRSYRGLPCPLAATISSASNAIAGVSPLILNMVVSSMGLVIHVMPRTCATYGRQWF